MHKLYEAWGELEDNSASVLAEFCRNSIISSHIPGYTRTTASIFQRIFIHLH